MLVVAVVLLGAGCMLTRPGAALRPLESSAHPQSVLPHSSRMYASLVRSLKTISWLIGLQDANWYVFSCSVASSVYIRMAAPGAAVTAARPVCFR